MTAPFIADQQGPFITDQSWAEHEAAAGAVSGRIGQILQIVDGGGADVQADTWDAAPAPAPAAPILAVGASTEGHLDSTLQQQLDALFAAAPGNVSIVSGFRTRAEQEALYAKYKAGTGNLAAVPGTSRHETGRAADLHYASPEVQQWVHEHAADYGLVFPINGEPWHVELAGARDTAPTSTPSSTTGMVSGDFHDRMAQIMGIVNGSGADPQTGQWSDMTAAPAPTDSLAPAGHLGVSAKGPVGGALSATDIYHVALAAGFSGEQAITMTAIALAESSGHPSSVNDNPKTGDLSYGLWQINMLGPMGTQRQKNWGLASYDDLKDPAVNAAAAFQLSGGGSHFGDWTTYTSGAYKAHLAEARAAAQVR